MSNTPLPPDRDSEHAARWARAADDPEFVAEADQLAREFASDDLAAWPD
jgi:hypothetical protein